MNKLILVSLIIIVIGGFLVCLAQPVTAAEKPKHGGILRFNTAKSVANIGEPVSMRGGGFLFSGYALEGLVELSNEDIGTIRPELATSWELAPDKSNYIFHLRKGVKFHDGTEFNAQAVKWNLDRYIKAKRTMASNISSIDVIDKYTVRANLKKWDRTVLPGFRAELISPTAFEKNGIKWAIRNPVGTGPFKVTEFKRDIHVKYERNPDYWDKGLPYLDGIFMTMIPDPMTAKAMMTNGDIDIWTFADAVSGVELGKTGKFIVKKGIGPNVVISFNSKDPNSIWSDSRMRMALEYAIDKDAMHKAIGHGFRNTIYEVIAGIPPKAGLEERRYNPEKARQMIKESGYKGDTVTLFNIPLPDLKLTSAAIQKYCADVGINLETKILTMAPIFKLIYGTGLKGSDIVIGPASGSPGVLFQHAWGNWHDHSICFQNSRKPEGYMAILEKAMTADSNEEAIKYLHQLEKLLRDDCIIVPLHKSEPPIILQPYVKGFYGTYGNELNPKLKWCWLDK